MKKESPLLAVLKDVEELRTMVSHHEELDIFLEKVEKLDATLSKMAIVDKLLARLECLEDNLYMLKEYWTVEDVARYLDISTSRAYRLSSEGKIAVHKPNDKKIYFKHDDVVDWIGRSRNPSVYELEQLSEDAANRYMLNLRNKRLQR